MNPSIDSTSLHFLTIITAKQQDTSQFTSIHPSHLCPIRVGFMPLFRLWGWFGDRIPNNWGPIGVAFMGAWPQTNPPPPKFQTLTIRRTSSREWRWHGVAGPALLPLHAQQDKVRRSIWEVLAGRTSSRVQHCAFKAHTGLTLSKARDRTW